MILELNIWDTIARILIAALCGGLIGIERGRKHRPAGFRTYMIVCMGAALTMILGTYLAIMLSQRWLPLLGFSISTDVSRLGAQVINGIGFLGAGTIIVTGKNQIKGLTTAAGLWASACMGLAIGAGFYIAALIACILIVITIVVFSKLEQLILMRSRNMNVYVEFENTDDVAEIVSKLKNIDVRIFDVEITKAKYAENKIPNAVISMQLPKKTPHTDIFSVISEIETVSAIEEL